MCDIIVATPKVTENGIMLFGKNSDRDPNEAQIVEFIPRIKHDEEKVKLTYVEFPQVEETNAVILSRPWWMFGAEMGANEYGLVIGNTAVFTKEPYQKIGITGMDMIRLALERTKSAKEALNFMISIIEKHGQGGSGSYYDEFYYHNSFIIADPKEAWVLETAGKYWVAKRVDKFYSISNRLTIERDWDLSSKDLERHAKEKYGCDVRKKGFASCFTGNLLLTHFARGKERRELTMKLLAEHEGNINVHTFTKILRYHRKEPFTPKKSSMRDICIHFKGTFTPSQTAGSQISYLGGDINIHWFTGTSNPCLSIYKPFVFELSPASLSLGATDKFDSKIYWWKHERFHRMFMQVYDKYFWRFRNEANRIEMRSFDDFMELYRKFKQGGDNKDKELIEKLVKGIYEEEKSLLEKWEERLSTEISKFRFSRAWKKANKSANLNF